MNKLVLVLGGAGFIGSNLAQRFVEAGEQVTIIDGLVERTGGQTPHLSSIRTKVEFIESRIEDIPVPTLRNFVARSRIIIDCMAWTRHQLALVDPVYDLELNAKSHLSFLHALEEGTPARIFYIGSRSQYGNPDVSEIDEVLAMCPNDIQGIHKLTGEHYYRVYSVLKNVAVISLRIPNCFGPNQPVKGEDIGLVGDFFRHLLAGRSIEIFGQNRKRCLLYVKDLAEIIYQLSGKSFQGFQAFNIRGQDILLEELVTLLIRLIGHGEYTKAALPHQLQKRDMGNASMNEARLQTILGAIPQTDLEEALIVTLDYFKEHVDDLAL